MLDSKDTAPKLPASHQENNISQLGNFRELPETEITNLMGDNFVGTMRDVYNLEDSFGLCGVIAIHASGLMTLPEAWRSVAYDVGELKEIFDRKMANGGVGQSAVETFRERYASIGANSFTRFAIDSLDSLNVSFERLRENQGLVVALVVGCEKHAGKHTHWLAVKRNDLDGNKIVVVGDLTPFGLKSYGIEMESRQLVKSLASAIGQRPTTKLTNPLTIQGHRDAFFNQGETFQINAGIFDFRKPV